MGMRWGLRLLSLSALLGWMAVIYAFSAQDGEESGALSDKIAAKVIEVFYPEYGQAAAEEQLRIEERVSYAVRKTAHATEYGILAALSFATMTAWLSWKQMWRFVMSFVSSVCYAATDEFHQTVVSGRVGSPVDVLIDGCGALLALALVFVCVRISEKRPEYRV